MREMQVKPCSRVVEFCEACLERHGDNYLGVRWTMLWAENVLARRYFYPGCHRMEPYRSHPPPQGPLEHTERLASRVLLLPTGTAVATDDIDAIGGLFRLIAAHADEARAKLLQAGGPAERGGPAGRARPEDGALV